ncbi:MAG: CARDB domain-containing protein, partial [Candidatus Methanomethylicaceae archaeon]
MYWTSAKVAAEGRSYLGVSGHLATITSIEESLFITNTFGSSINGAWLGGYQSEGSVEPGGGWSWVTGEPFIFTNWGSGEPNNSGGYEHYLQFRSDSDTEGKLWNDLPYWSSNYYLVEYDVRHAEDDWYFVTLSEGEKASLLLTSEGSFSTSNLSLELYDSSGNLLTAGIDVAANVDEAIVDFLAPAGGNYYIRVSGDVLGDYTLVVTRDLSFEIEPLSSSVVQDISPTNEILGALGFSGSGGGGGEIRVAVLGGGNTVSQLNDDTYFNFTATSVNASQIDTLVELNNYDVVVMGASQSKAELNQLAPVLRQWVEAGHGVVATGWTVYYAGSSSGAVVTDIDAIVPVNLNSSYYYDYYPTITIIDNSHPVTSGVTSFSASSQYAELTYGGIDSGATLLGTVSGYPAVVVGQSGSGRGVYLSPVYPYYTWTTGMADRLLEQAVAWAAGDSYDDYLIQVKEGDTLTISTRTPNDGSGEPLNLLDPRLELYDPDGNLVASDMDSGPNERNAELNYEALITGSYKVRVIREEGLGSGEYVFKVTGATGTFNAKPVVVSTNPSEGKTFSIPPESLTLDLSEGIRADSVGIDDLTIDHDASVTGIEIVDGDTIRFLLSVPDIEGTYTYTLLEDSVIDLLGEGNVSYTGTFVIDHTPPFVISQSPEVQSLSPFNSWSVTFSEPLDPSSVQTSDFVLRNPNNYTISISSATVSADGLTVTLAFSNQYTQGNYTLTVGPEITDLAGNRMDQDSATDGNQTYVGTIQVAAPDLNPVSITVTLPDGSPLPTEGVPLGSTVRVTWTVRNIGADAARANYWYDRIYISSNNNTNVSGDTQLNYFTVDVDPLAGNGGQYTMTQNVTLPLNDSFFASTYYLKVWVDGYSNQPETNENNNILASTAFTTVIPPLPDLIVTNVTAPAIVEAGKAAHIEWTDVNQGGAATTGSGWYDRVVLSGNTVFGDSDDVTLYSYYWYSGTLDAGGSVNRSLDVTISTGVVGNWYVLVKADVYSNIYERLDNENNNVGVSATQMNVVMATEDLSPLSLTAPDSAVFGETINVSWTVGNIGTGLTVSNWYDRIWLSRDTTPGNADDVSLTQVSSGDVTPLAPGAQYNRSVENIQLPLSSSWNPGSYYLILQTDVYNQEPETNENNNTMVRPISLSIPPIADLMVSNVTVTPSNINSGDIVEIRWTLTNNGTASASNFWDCVYLNKDNILDGSYSYYLSEFKFSDTLNPGESREIVQNVTIPINRPGDWYLVVSTDIYDDIYEHQNENNNQAVSNQIHAPLPPLPDLIVTDISAPKDALSGQTIPISWTIRNQGQKDIIDGQWTDTIFFSYDGGTSNNYHVGNFTYTGSLAVGQSVTRLIDFTLPSTLEGLRWIVVYTDNSNNYYEHDGENNNRMVDDTSINVK